MKNKKITYLLLLLVAVIWGIIFYRVVSGSSSAPIPSTPGNSLPSSFNSTSIPDTFSIFANYRDPFLDKVIQAPSENSNKVKTPAPAKVEKVIAAVKWPALSYGGIIKNQKSGKQLVLVNINGEGNIMRAGDEVAGIHLLKIYKDSIEVSFQKEKKMVGKQ